jgi:hypothetical protein
LGHARSGASGGQQVGARFVLGAVSVTGQQGLNEPGVLVKRGLYAFNMPEL